MGRVQIGQTSPGHGRVEDRTVLDARVSLGLRANPVAIDICILQVTGLVDGTPCETGDSRRWGACVCDLACRAGDGERTKEDEGSEVFSRFEMIPLSLYHRTTTF